jgi:hypothetical protein
MDSKLNVYVKVGCLCLFALDGDPKPDLNVYVLIFKIVPYELSMNASA